MQGKRKLSQLSRRQFLGSSAMLVALERLFNQRSSQVQPQAAREMRKGPQADQEWLRVVINKMPHLSKSQAVGLAMGRLAIAITHS